MRFHQSISISSPAVLLLVLAVCQSVTCLSFLPLHHPTTTTTTTTTRHHPRQQHPHTHTHPLPIPQRPPPTTSLLPSLPHHLADLPPLLTALAPPSPIKTLGNDIFTFLLSSVLTVPLCRSLSIPPVLGFLTVGCLLGPTGLGLFSNNEADIELGDFGILFLLFNEGLSLSPERIRELGRFTGLGLTQLGVSIAFIFIGSFWGGPLLLEGIQSVGIEDWVFDVDLVQPLVDNPVEAFCISAAGALSSSAFVLPVLKEKDWEDRPEGIASLSILLLQDLAVAPLLVLLPLLAGEGPTGPTELGLLVGKATIGFGSVLALGSIGLRYIFDFVAKSRSTETFVAAALLVAVGMGQAADALGLSASTGAFAAGVLLAGNQYRAQIRADIRPFEGILLGVFFLTAGGDLDLSVVGREWGVLGSGILVFVMVKAGILFLGGSVLGGLRRGEAARVAFVLAGGGEFALVLFSLAEDLGVLDGELAKLLIASVIVSMSLTPVLGEVGEYLGGVLDGMEEEGGGGGGVREDGLTVEEEEGIFDRIDADGSGTIELEELRVVLLELGFDYVSIAEIFRAFDENGDGVIQRGEWREGIRRGLLVDAFRVSPKEVPRVSGGGGGGEEGGGGGGEVSFRKDALVICGFGEIGKPLYTTLQASTFPTPTTPSTPGSIVCFDLNPARVTTGVLSGAPVVFGDGARLELLRAVGVTEPRAIAITYASEARRLEATERLRACFPGGDTPIYVFEGGGSGNGNGIGKELRDAGATEVVRGNVETVLRFASLVGALGDDRSGGEEDRDRLRSLLADENKDDDEYGSGDYGRDNSIPGLSEEFIIDLAEDIGCSRSDIYDFWTSFRSIANGRDAVPVGELREMILRQSFDDDDDDGGGGGNSCDGKDFEICLSTTMMEEDGDGSEGQGDLSFVEYCRALYITCSIEY